MTRLLTLIGRPLALALSCVLWAGCYAKMTTKDIPSLHTATPLNSPRPQAFALRQFVDSQSATSSAIIQFGVNRLTLEKPAAAMVTSAVQQEFERTGHRLIEDTQLSKGDFLIEGTVTQCALRRDLANTLTTISGSVEMTITIRPAAGGKKLFTKRYQGTHFASGTDLLPTVWREVLGQAIAATVKNMSMDRELAAFIHTL
jgi:uncharacterized lipoprotein YajG